MKFTDPRHTIINKSGFTKFIPQIAENISPYAAMLLAELLNSDSYWLREEKKYKKKYGREYVGIFFHNRTTIKKKTGLSPTYQRKAQKELEGQRIITVETKGLPRRNYFTINYDELDAFLLMQMKSPDTIQEDEQQEVDEDNNQSSTVSTPSGQRGQRLDVAQDDDINKNKETKIKNKSKVNPTYVPDGIDAFYQELGLGSINNKHTCIKKKESATPPGAHAQSGTDFDEALDIIYEYNRAMDIHINPGEKELNTTLENLEQLRKVRKYFNSDILNKVWNQYGDDYTNSLEHRRISAFIKCGLMAKLKSHHLTLSKTHDDEIDGLLDKIYRKYGNQISSIIENQGYLNNFGSLEPINASTHFPPKEHRRVRLQLYHQYIKGLLPKEEKHDMMKLEV